MSTDAPREPGRSDPLFETWSAGYSIQELWGFTAPVSRATAGVAAPHHLLWGIVSLVEQQVDRGAGHRYLRDRLAAGEWVAFGFSEPAGASPSLCRVPPLENAKFSRRRSMLGDAGRRYTSVRIVHAGYLD